MKVLNKILMLFMFALVFLSASATLVDSLLICTHTYEYYLKGPNYCMYRRYWCGDYVDFDVSFECTDSSHQQNRQCGSIGKYCCDTKNGYQFIIKGEDTTCDGIDNDCDGDIDDNVLSMTYQFCSNGVGECMRLATQFKRCYDGTWAWEPCPAVPGSPTTETCNNKDDDCDGSVDENVKSYSGCDQDGYCSGSYKTCSYGSWGSCSKQPRDETCNNVDDDCDGYVDENLRSYSGCDQDGYCNGAYKTCSHGSWGSCSISPRTETCNGIDDDCDSSVDEYLTSQVGCKQTGYCSGSYKTCNYGSWGSCSKSPKPETCNGIDDDCDGSTDEYVKTKYYWDQDGDGFGTSSYNELCSSSGYYRATKSGDCTDGNSGIFPGATEVCNGFDDDCDGQTDENLLKKYYYDADNDGYGTSSSQDLCSPSGYYRATQSGDCDDSNSQINPSRPESCNGVDDNCNGNKDEGCECIVGDTTPCGTNDGECRKGHYECKRNGWDTNTCIGGIAPSPEVCDGKDNDCDGIDDNGLPMNTYYRDADGDTYVDLDNHVERCLQPTGYLADNSRVDCDDTNSNTNPGADEVCDGDDNNCNGEVDEGVKNACGGCGPVPDEVCDGADNNCDGLLMEDEYAYSTGIELCDGLDNDCDGIVDNNVGNEYYQDFDDDGYTPFPNNPDKFCQMPDGYCDMGIVDETPVKLGNKILTNTYTSDYQYEPAVAYLNDGSFVIVWASQNQDGDTYGIFGQIFNQDGTMKGNEFQINTYNSYIQHFPDVAALDNGFVVVWESYFVDNDNYGIAAQRFDSSGNKLGSEFIVNTYTKDGQLKPSISKLGTGFVVVWQSKGQGDDWGYGIFAQRYNSVGNKLGSEFHVNTFVGSNQHSADVAEISNGFVVVWNSFGDGGAGKGLFGQRFDSSGNKLGGEFQITNVDLVAGQFPSVSALNTGFVVTWINWNLYASIYSSDGQPIASDLLIDSLASTYMISPPSVASLNDGFVVVWERKTETGGYEVAGRKYDPSGNKLGSKFQIDSQSSNKDLSPYVAAKGDKFIAAWANMNDQMDVYTQRLSSPSGQPILGENSCNPNTFEHPDCDDNDPDKNPGAYEKCNLIDDDCDEYVDEFFNPSDYPVLGDVEDVFLNPCPCVELNQLEIDGPLPSSSYYSSMPPEKIVNARDLKYIPSSIDTGSRPDNQPYDPSYSIINDKCNEDGRISDLVCLSEPYMIDTKIIGYKRTNQLSYSTHYCETSCVLDEDGKAYCVYDADGDGYCSHYAYSDSEMKDYEKELLCPNGGNDCDDGNPDVPNVDGSDPCDNIDNDCDGLTDEGETEIEGQACCIPEVCALSSEAEHGVDEDCDGTADYDTQLVLPDSDCPVNVEGISISNKNPCPGETIEVICYANAWGVNSILVSGLDNCMFEQWDSDQNNPRAFFRCNSGGAGSKTVSCLVNAEKSFSDINEQSDIITVGGAQCCGDYTDNNICIADQNCEWCPLCGNQFPNTPVLQSSSDTEDSCVAKGNCAYQCHDGVCGAECDADMQLEVQCTDYCEDMHTIADVQDTIITYCDTSSCNWLEADCDEDKSFVGCGYKECKDQYDNTQGDCRNTCVESPAHCEDCTLNYEEDCYCIDGFADANEDTEDGCECMITASEDIGCPAEDPNCGLGDGIDNDCDGQVDEDIPVDTDNDGSPDYKDCWPQDNTKGDVDLYDYERFYEPGDFGYDYYYVDAEDQYLECPPTMNGITENYFSYDYALYCVTDESNNNYGKLVRQDYCMKMCIDGDYMCECSETYVVQDQPDSDDDGVVDACDSEADEISCTDGKDNDGNSACDIAGCTIDEVQYPRQESCDGMCASCEECGKGWLNACGEAECEQCGICTFIDGLFSNDCFTDTDQDGIPDDEDNCKNTPNPTQLDTDNDGYGDACDDCSTEDKIPIESDLLTQEECYDNIDNDCNQQTDCDDDYCASLVECGGSGICNQDSPNSLSLNEKEICYHGNKYYCDSSIACLQFEVECNSDNICQSTNKNTAVYFCNNITGRWQVARDNNNVCTSVSQCLDTTIWLDDPDTSMETWQYACVIGKEGMDRDNSQEYCTNMGIKADLCQTRDETFCWLEGSEDPDASCCGDDAPDENWIITEDIVGCIDGKYIDDPDYAKTLCALYQSNGMFDECDAMDETGCWREDVAFGNYKKCCGDDKNLDTWSSGENILSLLTGDIPSTCVKGKWYIGENVQDIVNYISLSRSE